MNKIVDILICDVALQTLINIANLDLDDKTRDIQLNAIKMLRESLENLKSEGIT